MLTALHFIAERKIEQAIRKGELADLSHWKNKPMPKDDMANVPVDLRLGYRMLKNAGYVPEEISLQKEIVRIEDLLRNCEDEHVKYQQLKKLNFLRFKLECRMGKKLQLDDDSPYYSKVVDRVAVGEKQSKK